MTVWTAFTTVFWAAALAFAGSGGGEMPEQYRQPFSESYDIRIGQFEAMQSYLSRLPRQDREDLDLRFEPDFASLESYQASVEPFRAAARSYLKMPPPRLVSEPKVRLERIGEDRYATIYRAWVTLLEGVDLYSLYMVPKQATGKSPLIIAQHGGGGCPEAICDLDTRVNYDSFGPQAVRRGYIVWAPYSIMPVPYAGDSREKIDRAALDRQARAAGLSLQGIEVYQIGRGAEVLAAARPEIDPERIGMTGLSYGGGMTIRTMALFPTIKVGVAGAGFRGKDQRPGPTSVQWVGAICPRPLMIQSGDADTVVRMADVLPGIPEVESFYSRLEVSDRFIFDRHPGGHVFVTSNVLDFFDAHLR